MLFQQTEQEFEKVEKQMPHNWKMGYLKGRGRNEEQTVKSTGLNGEEYQDADKNTSV